MLSPIDIENKTFKKTKFGGYDINDVEDFLELLIVDYENLYKESAELKDRVNNLQESVSYYKSIEEGLNQTIENAELSASSIKDEAKREAETLIKETEYELKKRLDEIKMDIKQKEYELENIKKQMDIYKIKTTSMLEAQLKILKEEN